MDHLKTSLSTFASALASATPFSQQQRLFTLRFERADLDAQLLPHSVQGSEQLSETYRIELVCLSADGGIALKQLIGLGVDIAIHHEQGERTIAGIVTGARKLGADGGFARYGLSVEPALATLRLRRNSRVFQDKSVIDIVRLLLDEQIECNPVFARHFRHNSDL